MGGDFLALINHVTAPVFNQEFHLLYSVQSWPNPSMATEILSPNRSDMLPSASKKRKLALSECKAGRSPKFGNAFARSAANWDLEATYVAKRKKRKENTKLPIKTPDGRVHDAELGDRAATPRDDEWENDPASDQNRGGAHTHEKANHAPILSEPDPAQIKAAKEELAKIATAVNQEPEENPFAFKTLAEIGSSPFVAVQKLALVTQMAVYRDVIPGYRVRPLSEQDTKEKISKEVRKLRTYEQSLITSYERYVATLARCAKLDPEGSQGLPGVAITCTCTLVTSVPHFNFRGNLLSIIISKLSKLTVDEDFVKCRRALEDLFEDDEGGDASLEAVSLLNKMMKARSFRVDESVLNLFLHLRILSECLPGGGQVQDAAPKLKKNQRSFRNKRQRKALKEQKAVEKDMALVNAQVDYEERERKQSETLKLVFSSYLRILKMRLPRLMGAVLEGLAKYAHLINMDFFGDLLEAMIDLINHIGTDEMDSDVGAMDEDGDDGAMIARNTSREVLLCTMTAFTLFDGRHAAKARSDPDLDVPFFQNHLFQSLVPLATKPDLELGNKPDRLRDSGKSHGVATNGNKVNLHTTAVLLLRCLTAALLPRFNARALPPPRVAAFTKQAMTMALQTPEKSTTALLTLLCDVAKMHARKVAGLWNTQERLADGVFRPQASDPERSNPFAATVWEGELLRKHFSPSVRQGLKLLERAIEDTVTAG